MKKRVKLACVTIACVCLMAACGTTDNNVGNANENQDPLTGEEISDTQESQSQNDGMTDMLPVTDEFDSILNESDNPSDVIDYINTNIGTAAENDVKRFFDGILNFGDDIRNIDFTQLDESKQYMPEDMIAFMELMKLEADTPSMVMSDEENRKVIGLTLSEMLERALLFEQHLQKYPNEVSSEAAQRLYEEIATNAISGGYDKTNGIEHYYRGETSEVVDNEALAYYQQFADANPDSNLGMVVKEYIALLQKNQFSINDEMEDFYRSLYQRLDMSEFNTNAADNSIADSAAETINH